MDFQQDFAAAQKSLSQALVSTTRSATRLAAQDLPFHRSIEPKLGNSLYKQSHRLLALTQKLLARCGTSTATDMELEDVESIDTNWRTLVDAADGLLEQADSCLDEYKGLVRQSTPRDTGSPAPSKRNASRKGDSFHPSNPPKPQLLFDIKPQNNQSRPFRPFLTNKPHAAVSLEKSLVTRPNEAGEPQYLHPYATEISSYEYPSFVYSKSEPYRYLPFETTTATLVDTLEGVRSMLEELKKASIIAIDLEHHDAHSYIGIVSLMQISTRDHDWIIDTLKPWRRKLEMLNEVFADPSILKVLHGAFMDAVWLQRDLGLYLVGLFDTYHAARVLGYPGGSLAYLLKHFVNFDAQKQYQTADWRIRPLPQQMFDYARSDTHFLLYIFDNMRNELVEKSDFNDYDKDKVQAVLERSNETALQRYEYCVYDEKRGQGYAGWYSQLQRSPSLLSKEQFAVYRKIHQWRDSVAREEDESPHQIMTKNVLINVSQVLPRDVPSLLSICQPVSQPLRLHASELIALIKEALAGAANAPEMHQVLTDIANELGFFVSEQTISASNANQNSKSAVPPKVAADSSKEVSYEGPSEDSQFWGKTLTLPTRNDSNTLPLGVATIPSLTPYKNANFSLESTNNTTSALSTPSVLRKRKGANVLTPATESKKQKLPTPEHPASTTDEAAAAMELKMRRKAEKKAAKRVRKAEPAMDGNEIEADAPAAFDYSTALSVLHGGGQDSVSSGKKKHERIDPYAKAAQSPSGVKGVRNSRVGKSQTFKR